jgi:3-keto-5-aminohexanoate cleavage enzyme
MAISGKELLEQMAKDVTIHLEPRVPTMDKKLVITVAVNGAFQTKVHNPNIALTPPEVVEQVIECYKAGAAIWHVHLRDETGILDNRPDIVQGAIEQVLAQCPDMIFSHTGHASMDAEGVERIRPLVDPLTEAGRKNGKRYIETVVIAPYLRVAGARMNKAILQDMIKYLQDKGVKPEFQIHNYTCIHHVNEWILQPGLMERPVMNLCSGYHGYDYSGPHGPVDPWGHLYVINMMNLMPPGSVIGATIGGRNWLPLTTLAIMLGADCVRIGMEDACFMYPHRDEKIRRCVDVISKVRRIAEELGREIATPREARQILGLAA